MLSRICSRTGSDVGTNLMRMGISIEILLFQYISSQSGLHTANAVFLPGCRVSVVEKRWVEFESTDGDRCREMVKRNDNRGGTERLPVGVPLGGEC